MSFLKNTVSLFALFSVIPAAYAVTARPSVLNATTARRMPTMSAYITGATGGATSTTTTASSLLANAECIDAYTQCIKGGDACGANFEECTTKVLFHAKMPQCLSTLAQCSSDGVSSLFGTSTVSALSNVATKNSYGEITDYTYPTDGSVLGQMISAAAIENKYDTSSCVRRYSSCLRKDSVCGADFELCTTNSEFKKQRVFCDSTLARCQSEGLIELFGTASTTATPSASSRIGEMIAEGAALAAVNAVSTCYKVVDQCILNACTANPYKCYENATAETVNIVDAITNGTDITAVADATAIISKSNISSYIKNSCLDTVGSNKYCYATFIGDGQMPTSSQLRDEDNQEEVYDLAYSARMNSGMRAKITDLVNKFDTRAKEKCVETISSCAMRTCGGGVGSACYSLVKGNAANSINYSDTLSEIKEGCQSIVNTDLYCQYAAQNPNATGTYNYSFIQADAFDKLFPEYDDGAEDDPIGVIASLNAKLASSYNDAAIAQMRKRCQSVATSCVKSMCGNDFVNCYRNRTDIYSSLTASGKEEFDKSMNKVGGVLDYTIVLGLCVDTVKNADVCSEHLAIEKVKYTNNSDLAVWGDATDTRDGWLDAGQISLKRGDGIQATDENGNKLCTDTCGNQGICDSVSIVENCGVYQTPVMISEYTYAEQRATESLFKELIYDLEIEAQAKYNAKLTQQQNMCMSSNDGGILGKDETGSTFMWAKLRGSKVPANYTVAGLKPNQFVASNDLYGSFCRVRITLQSNDRELNELLRQGQDDWSTAYFAAGDTFTCGSWIPTSKLEALANQVAGRARADAKASQPKIQGWMTALGTLGGGAGGAFLGAGIQKGDVFSGLTGIGKDSKKASTMTAQSCTSFADGYKNESNGEIARFYGNSLIIAVENMDSGKAATENIESARAAINAAAQTTIECPKVESKDDKGKFVCRSGWTESAAKSEAKKKANTEIDNLAKICKTLVGNGDTTTTDKKGLSTGAAAGIGAGVGAIAGGILTNRIVASIQDQELNDVQRAAYNEFMDSIGSKIRCYVGADEVGMYGDVISTSME